uniref:Uncharacterized protein n=1 Tax=viral metagenome TaxID=1070528 RepID=A0A6C0BNV4_9ZZZZ
MKRLEGLELRALIFELKLLSTLDLDRYDDESLADTLQDALNAEFGVHASHCCGQETPRVYAKVTNMDTARRVAKRFIFNPLFWSDTLGDTPMERQWQRDLSYIPPNAPWEKYHLRQWRSMILRERRRDPGTIMMDAPVFMDHREAFDHFSRKRFVPEYYSPPVNQAE